MAEKFKSKLRDKFKKGGGRSLSYGDRTVEDYYGEYDDVVLPKSQRKRFNTSLKQAMQNRAKEVLSGGKETVGSKVRDSVKEIHKGLTGTRHPAQLIPAANKARNLTDIIKALTKK